jgi:hypothetical protein
MAQRPASLLPMKHSAFALSGKSKTPRNRYFSPTQYDSLFSSVPVSRFFQMIGRPSLDAFPDMITVVQAVAMLVPITRSAMNVLTRFLRCKGVYKILALKMGDKVGKIQQNKGMDSLLFGSASLEFHVSSKCESLFIYNSIVPRYWRQYLCQLFSSTAMRYLSLTTDGFILSIKTGIHSRECGYQFRSLFKDRSFTHLKTVFEQSVDLFCSFGNPRWHRSIRSAADYKARSSSHHSRVPCCG